MKERKTIVNMMYHYIKLNVVGNLIRSIGVTVELILAKKSRLPLYK